MENMPPFPTFIWPWSTLSAYLGRLLLNKTHLRKAWCLMIFRAPPGLGRSPGGGHGHPPQHSCLENPQGQRSLEGYSPLSQKELDMTEQLRPAQHRIKAKSSGSFSVWDGASERHYAFILSGFWSQWAWSVSMHSAGPIVHCLWSAIKHRIKNRASRMD